ncbi:MAG: TrkH family potassium uptake protein [Dehalococcoidia bacterium]
MPSDRAASGRSREPVRLRRMGTVEVRLQQVRPTRTIGSGSLRMLAGFALVLVLGSLLLMIPAATEDGVETGPIDALFTATSAMCLTGHILFDTSAHWSFYGEIVILVLIQIGGLGYMVGASLMIWILGRQLGMKDRQLLRLYYGAPSLGEALSFARTIALGMLAIEGAGMVILFVEFLSGGHSLSQSAWWAVFHSISAFNNAGFSVTGTDFVEFQGNGVVLGTIAALVILGGLGVMPVVAVLAKRSWSRLALDTRLVILMSGLLLVAGTILIYAFEVDTGATVGAVGPGQGLAVSFFESAMARTAGFSAVTVRDLADETKLSLIVLMFIGGVAGSTAGGIKVGTFALTAAAVYATIRGRQQVVIMRRRIPEFIIRQALTITLGGIIAVVTFTLMLTVAVDAPFIDVFFDAVSALGTVGLSTGAVQGAGTVGRLMFIAAMLVGRFGPLVLVLEMNRQRKRSTYRVAEDSIRFG